jgi:nucleoside-diphosphate-sugar epimerase
VSPSSGQRVLVTGATGFVGGHLAERLVARGDTVRCLVRPRSDRQWLPPAVEFTLGTIDDSAALAQAVTGVNVVYHLAAVTSAVRASDYDRTNRIAVIRLLQALKERSPRARLVFCSSMAAGGPALHGRPLTESDAAAPAGPYGQSKRAAEQAIAASGIDAVMIRPPAVYGPRDRDVLAGFRLAARGLAIRTGPAGQMLSFIHVHDLARALAAAGVTPAATGVLYVNGGNYPWEEVVAVMGDAVGKRPTIVPLPEIAVRAAGRAVRAWARVAHIKPLITPERAWDLRQMNWTCDDSTARRLLGYAPTLSLAEGMRDTAAWYRAHGWM